jgi:hypothetical protein
MLDVFSGDGEFLGSLALTGDLAKIDITYITEDHIFGVVQDELGVQSAVKLEVRPRSQ